MSLLIGPFLDLMVSMGLVARSGVSIEGYGPSNGVNFLFQDAMVNLATLVACSFSHKPRVSGSSLTGNFGFDSSKLIRITIPYLANLGRGPQGDGSKRNIKITQKTLIESKRILI